MRSPNWTLRILVAVVVVALCAIIVGGCSSYYGEDSVVLRVRDKESVSTDSGHEYRVYSDKGTFVMKDSIIKGRTATGDDYGKIVRGHTYRCTKIGWRIPLFSEFENLIKCNEVVNP